MIIKFKDETKAKAAYKWLSGRYDFCTSYKGVEPFGEYRFGILLKAPWWLQKLEKFVIKLVLA